MILRRLADGIRTQNWFIVIIEILIVVIGIFLGLQVNEWNQARIDRADEAVFLQALHQDIVEMEKITKRTLSFRLKYFTDMESAADVLFGRTEQRPLTQDECKALGTSHITAVLPTSLPSMITLRDAGRTGIIRNSRLVGSLAKLTQRQEALTYIIESVSRTAVDLARFYPKLIQTVPVIVPLAGDPKRTEYDLAQTCDGPGLAKDPSALNAIAYNLEAYDAVVNLVGIKSWVEQTKAVHEQLDAMLNIQHAESAE